jgi:hypothetical protein
MAIDHTELDPCYALAHKWLEIPSSEYFVNDAPPFSSKLLSRANGITNRFFRFSPPTRYGVRYRESVENDQGALHSTGYRRENTRFA